ncbi:hypothetical protein, partial [Actinotignum sanguinis]|uniref:hypothetical protein n=1 Tax=Actinotignum sanguinis TaxID=1445614 RepID=UPI00254F733C
MGEDGAEYFPGRGAGKEHGGRLAPGWADFPPTPGVVVFNAWYLIRGISCVRIYARTSRSSAAIFSESSTLNGTCGARING